MIYKVFFITSFVLLLLSLFSSSTATEKKPQMKKTALVHKIATGLYLLNFAIGIYFLKFDQAHRFLVYTSIYILIWLIITGPLLEYFAKTKLLFSLYRVTGLISAAVLICFLFLLV